MLPDWIEVKAVLKTLFLPPTGLLLLALAGLIVMRARPRLGRLLALLGVTVLLLLSIPVVSTALQRAIDDTRPFAIADAANARAIVILGSGVRRHASEYAGQDTLGLYTLERVRYGAHLARTTGLPVMVTGGAVVRGATPEAPLMRDALEHEFGVTVRWMEERSRTTHENAQFTAAILIPAGIRQVVLVAHSIDMRRARAEFADAGITTVPAPIAHPALEPDTLADFLPGIGGLAGSYRALYEIGGETVRRIAAATR